VAPAVAVEIAIVVVPDGRGEEDAEEVDLSRAQVELP
jgi:hypothetical protein